jgi:hypothetical protein
MSAITTLSHSYLTTLRSIAAQYATDLEENIRYFNFHQKNKTNPDGPSQPQKLERDKSPSKKELAINPPQNASEKVLKDNKFGPVHQASSILRKPSSNHSDKDESFENEEINNDEEKEEPEVEQEEEQEEEEQEEQQEEEEGEEEEGNEEEHEEEKEGEEYAEEEEEEEHKIEQGEEDEEEHHQQGETEEEEEQEEQEDHEEEE